LNDAAFTRTEHTRRAILNAALRLFAEQGYAGAGIQAIAKAAHVTKPVLYYHFGSKAGLFEAVARRTEDELATLIGRVAAEGGDLRRRLAGICAAIFRCGRLHPEALGLAAQFTRIAGKELPPQTHGREKTERFMRIIQEVMEQGQASGSLRAEFSSRQLAFGFLGTIHFHLVLCPPGTGRGLSCQQAEQAVSLFLKGAAAERKVWAIRRAGL
jgi:AcrR family transcriptional regulator